MTTAKPGEVMATIRSLLPSLLPTEQSVAQVLLSRSNEIVELSSQQVADLAGASRATVVRTCQSLGFSGYQQLRVLLARDAGCRAAAGAPLADVFGFLARYYRGRFSAAVVVVRAAVEPLTILLLGLLVGGFIYSIFRAMVALIQGVLGAPPGGTL